MARKRILFYLACIVLVGVLLRTPSLLVNFANIDENEYALAGQIINQGGIPYKDFLIYQPPAIYYLYALVFKLVPATELVTEMWWVHIVFLLIVAATCLAIYLVGKDVYKEPTRGLFAALFYAIFSTTFLPQDMLAANIELLMVLPMTLCVLFFLKEQFFVAGLFLGFSILTKYQGGILLPALIVYQLLSSRRKSGSSNLKNWIPAFAGMTSLILGAAWIGAGWVYYLYHNGALPDAIRCFFYILDYAKGPPGMDVPYITLKFLLRTAMMAVAGFGLWYFAFRAMKSSLHQSSFLFTLWLLFGFLAVIAGGRMYFHYYIILYPALSLLAGDWAGHFFERLKGMPFEKGAWRLTLFVIMIFIPVTGFTAYATYKPFRPKHKDYWIYVVDYIQARTGPADPIFVWGYCPQIYTVSDRRPATRFTTSDYLTGRSPKTAGLEFDPQTANPPSVWQKLRRDFGTPSEVIDYDTSDNVFPGAWELLIEDFKKNPPVLIVDTSPSNYRMYGRYPMTEFPRLEEYVKKNYVFEASIRGMDIYRRQRTEDRGQKTKSKE